MPYGFGNNVALYSGAGGGCRPAPVVQAAARTSPGWGGLIPLFILVGLLALFIPGGFFFILLLILLLILICTCGVCGMRY
jgi:hypothetical protein